MKVTKLHAKPRLDRNGIPILDPPHEANKLRPCCKTPEDHVWGDIRVESEDRDELPGYVIIHYAQACRRCMVVDRWTETR